MIEFPVFNSKALSSGRSYVLTDRADRLRYFHAKLGSKIDEVKGFLDKNSFVGYMLAKKQAGKGTYAKMVEEILGPERFAHISAGDLVRNAHTILTSTDKASFISGVQRHYRGFLSIDDAMSALLARTQDKVSVPTELMLALLKLEIDKIGKKALFIDGLPRNLDQVSYSLYFRDLINYRDDPDFFVLIDVPESVIDARMKNRVVCPECHTSKSVLINPTKFVRYDKEANEYYFLCDNPNCKGFETARYQAKEGDMAGIESIRGRLELDQDLIAKATALYGIPKILVRSTIPTTTAKDVIEDYEVQKCYTFSGMGDTIISSTSPWVVKDDAGVDCVTPYAATFVVNIFSQLHAILIGDS